MIFLLIIKVHIDRKLIFSLVFRNSGIRFFFFLKKTGDEKAYKIGV